MAKRKKRVPGYRLHKASGQAVVTVRGKDHYLGKHGTAKSNAEYDRIIAEYLAGVCVRRDAMSSVVRPVDLRDHRVDFRMCSYGMRRPWYSFSRISRRHSRSSNGITSSMVHASSDLSRDLSFHSPVCRLAATSRTSPSSVFSRIRVSSSLVVIVSTRMGFQSDSPDPRPVVQALGVWPSGSNLEPGPGVPRRRTRTIRFPSEV
jgi:hypothetical protein